MDRRRLDGFLVTNLLNVRYLTGFSGTAGMVLLTLRDALFFTDFRYETQAGNQIRGARVQVASGSLEKAAAAAANRRRLKRVGFEAGHVTVQTHKSLRTAFKASLRATHGILEKLRSVKDDDELAAIETAVELADAACTHAAALMAPGMTEVEIALELERHMRQHGAERAAFEFIVASGKRAALPHGVASSKKLEPGDLVTLDLGCTYRGYCSDLTRTFCMGEPTARQQRVYGIVREAQLTALGGLHAGLTGKEVDALARDLITRRRYGKRFGHGLGHGVGLAIHEQPRLAHTVGEKLEPNMVVTIEPGIYIPGWGGVRIEDMAVVTADGCRVLTRSPKPDRLPCLPA